MPLKTYILEGTIDPGASWKRIASLTTPTAKTRRFVENRIYISEPSGVRLRLVLETDTIHEYVAELENAIRYPHAMDLVVGAGQTLVLEAANSGSATARIIVELDAEETVK